MSELTSRIGTGSRSRRPVTVGAAIEQFLTSPHCNESANTYRAYASALHRVGARSSNTGATSASAAANASGNPTISAIAEP